MMRPIPADVLDAAHQTAQMELELDPDLLRALRVGLEAGFARHAQHVRREDAEMAARIAEDTDIDTDDEFATDAPAALLALAMQLREELPPEDEVSYVPAEDDLVELILYGTVVLGDPGSGRWSVITADFSSIDLDPKLSGQVMVRLIRRSA